MTSRMLSKHMPALVLVLIFQTLLIPAYGQGSARGTIVGNVTDQNGAVLSKVTVTVTNPATNVRQSVVTSETGSYTIPDLPVGTYQITAELPSFKKAVVENARLEVGATFRADITMEPGEISAQVVVEATSPVLRTDNAEVSHVIERERVVGLPLNGRDFQQLTLLTPGAVNASDFQTSAGLGGGASALTVNNTMIVSNGARPGAQLFLVDGANTSNQNGRATLFAPNVDEIEEFRVAGSDFSAEFGYGSNVINVSTKSGSNQFHGSLWEFHRNDAFDARGFFAPTIEPLKRNQFGGAIGGPVYIPRFGEGGHSVRSGKDRTFFFFSYEGQRQLQGQTTIASVPTAKMRNGDLSELPTIIYDPATSRRNATGTIVRDPFPGNIIPTNRIDPVSALFLQWVPLPNRPGISGNFVNQPSVRDDYNHYTGRIDHRLRNNDSILGRFSYHPETLPFGVGPYYGASKEGYNPGTFGKVANGASGVLSWTHTFSPTTLLETSGSYGRAYLNLNNPDIRPGGIDYTAFAGIQGFGKGISDVYPSIPGFSYSGFSGLPGGGFSLVYVSNSYEYTSNLTMVRGNHTVKVGETFRIWQQNLTTSGGGSGNFGYDGNWTRNPAAGGNSGSGLADYLLGVPNSGSRYVPPGWFYERIRNNWAYVQDDWKVNQKLTVNLGLRYELNFPTIEKYDQISTFVPSARGGRGAIVVPNAESISSSRYGLHSSVPLSLPTYGNLIITAAQAGIPERALRFLNKKQFAPRIGFAYRPLEDLTVRAGYGIYYNQLDGNRESELLTVPFLIRESGLQNNPTETGAPSATTATLLPKESKFSPVPFLLAHNPYDKGFGYTQQWNLFVQKLLPAQFSFEVGYVGTKGTGLQTGRNLNAPLPGPGTIQNRRPFPDFGGITWNEQSASSIYHALQSKVERRFSKGFTLLGSFTWSKAIDNSSESAQGLTNPFDASLDRGLSSFDVPFNFTLSSVYEFPFFRRDSVNPVVRHILGGWVFTEILTLRSGLPFTPVWSGDVSNTGSGARPKRICSGRLDNPTLNHWFDTSCFVAPDPFTFGNSGRNILRGDSYENLDLGLYRNFSFSENQRVQFRAEFFNVLNHPNFALPVGTINTPSAGRVFGSSPGRIIQFALKYNF